VIGYGSFLINPGKIWPTMRERGQNGSGGDTLRLVGWDTKKV
jgi:hypothetical protein